MPQWAQASVTGENLDSLGGRYQLIAKLGAGGMCEVFLASARGLRSFHKLVVIKRMLASTTMLQGSERMFMDEAEITARFNHPNVVQTFEIVSDAEHLSIVMEFLEGQPLDRIFDVLESEDVSRTVLADRNVWVRVIADALKGLHYAHELRDYDGQPLNIVHRDISPQNLFLTYDGVVKIVDFGIAKAALRSNVTEAGTLKGKIGYMAPEQAQCGLIDRRTDIFSTGVVLWEFLAGRYLRAGDTLTELQKIVSHDTPALSTVMNDVPSALEAIVAKATARDPDDRYATAQEMRLALEAYLADQESAPTTADVGQAITPHFEQDRRFLRERVREVVSGTPPGVVSQTVPVGLGAAARLRTTAVTSGIVTSDGTLQKTLESSRRRRVIVAVVLSAVALLAVAALWLVSRMNVDAPALADTHRVTGSKADFTEATNTVEAEDGATSKRSLPLNPIPAAKTPPEPEASGETESDDKVPVPTADSGGQVKPRVVRSQPKANPVPKARPAPTQPNIPIIDEGSDAKVNVDVIE